MEQAQMIDELETQKQTLTERQSEMTSKVKELEGKLELELATKKRIESQVSRLKEQIERISAECDSSSAKEVMSSEQAKKLARQLRQNKEESALLSHRNTELVAKKQE